MSQLVPFLNFGIDDSQFFESDQLYTHDIISDPKMVSDALCALSLLRKY